MFVLALFLVSRRTKIALEKFYPILYNSSMLRCSLLCTLLVFAGGCQFNRSFAPISPSQYISSNQSRLGIEALEQGKLNDAEKRLEEAVRLSKNDVNYRRHYAEVLWQQGKHQEALQQLDEAVKRGGQDDVALHISLAEKYLADQQYETAHRYADEAVRINPQDYRSWALRGRAKWLQASQQAGYIEHTLAILHIAREDYFRAISLSPNNRELLTELAMVQMGCGQPEQALATWLTLQNLYPPGGEPNEVLIGITETLAVLQRFGDAELNLLAIRQRGLEHTESGRRLQAIITANQNEGVRR